jgi:PelA/Pel-15E family pectate lyase
MLKSKLRTLSLTLMLTVGLTATPAVIFQPSVTVFAAESSVTDASISDILKYQQPDGGWKKNYTVDSDGWFSTIDNGATYTEIRKLATEYTKTKDSKYSAAVIKGINFLLNMQYSNGGWPQVYKSSGYHTHITYNDDAMVNVMILLDEVSNKKGNFSFIDSTLAAKSKTAVAKGVDCILKTQVVVNGKLTVWGQQHDENTLKPAGARAYEIPSLCSKESVEIVKFLKTRPTTTQIAASIKAAEDWFRATKITGIEVVKIKDSKGVTTDAYIKSNSNASPIWSRFYEIGTNKPLFSNRNGDSLYALKDVEQERRAGYSWYGAWPSALIK